MRCKVCGSTGHPVGGDHLRGCAAMREQLRAVASPSEGVEPGPVRLDPRPRQMVTPAQEILAELHGVPVRYRRACQHCGRYHRPSRRNLGCVRAERRRGGAEAA